MEEKRTGKYVYVRRIKKEQQFNTMQLSIIIVIISLIGLLSLWLPAHFS